MTCSVDTHIRDAQAASSKQSGGWQECVKHWHDPQLTSRTCMAVQRALVSLLAAAVCSTSAKTACRSSALSSTQPRLSRTAQVAISCFCTRSECLLPGLLPPRQHMGRWLYSRSFMSSFLVIRSYACSCSPRNIQMWDDTLLAMCFLLGSDQAAVL